MFSIAHTNVSSKIILLLPPLKTKISRKLRISDKKTWIYFHKPGNVIVMGNSNAGGNRPIAFIYI